MSEKFVQFCKLIRDIEMVIVERGKTGYSIRLQLADKTYWLNFTYAWETRVWVEAIRRAIEFERNSSSTLHGELKFNAENIHMYYFDKLEGELVKEISTVTAPIKKELDSLQFANSLSEVANLWTYLADALYAKKPFVPPLFKKVAVMVHSDVSETARSFWNRYSKGMTHSTITTFAQGLYNYENYLSNWGVFDQNFLWKTPLTLTYINRMTNISSLTIGKLLLNAPSSIIKSESTYSTPTATELEAHLWIIFSFYSKVPLPEVAEHLLKYCALVLDNFFLEMIILLKEKWHKSKFYIALLNNKYVKIIKNFQRKIHSQTESQVSLKEVKEFIHDSQLIMMINRIEKEAMFRLRKSWRRKVKQIFFENLEFVTRDFSSYFTRVVKKFTDKVVFVESRFLQQTLLQDVFEKICSCYVGLFVEATGKGGLKCTESLSKKIYEDIRSLEKILVQANIQNPAQFTSRLKKLYQFSTTDDIDICSAAVLSLHVCYKKLFLKTNIDRIIESKIYFSSETISHIISSFKAMISDSNRRSLSKKKVNTTIMAYFFGTFMFSKFRKIVNRFRQKQISKYVEKEKRKSLIEMLISMDCNLGKIYETRGYLTYMKFDIKMDELAVEEFAEKEMARDKNQLKGYFVFKPDILLIFKEQGEKHLIESIMYKTITCLNTLNNDSFFFKSKHSGFILMFKGTPEETAKTWFDHLTILRDKLNMVRVHIIKVDITERLSPEDFAERTYWVSDSPKLVFDIEQIEKDLQKQKIDQQTS